MGMRRKRSSRKVVVGAREDDGRWSELIGQAGATLAGEGGSRGEVEQRRTQMQMRRRASRQAAWCGVVWCGVCDGEERERPDSDAGGRAKTGAPCGYQFRLTGSRRRSSGSAHTLAHGDGQPAGQ
ncbi:hypothetical protein DM02DRAFT_622855 [Periconia macrospinosa]|uniref:Uncharacterized protein n=1 Tax=Periconia macrospinosa TaxID=97972 RepID=A0A2V1EBR5_9PLEO|nr:hypothetical protein DM02DRAFT_622855 [Periconia macrospinosa]